MITFRAKTEQGWSVDSPLRPVTFPDGAVHMQGTEAETIYRYQLAYVTGMKHDDLFMLAMWSKACLARQEEMILVLPYLPGARMDRGVVNGAQVYAEFLGEFVNPDQTITIDPHSSMAYEYFDNALRNFSSFPVERIIRKEVQDGASDSRAHKYVGVIAPDKGAHERAAAAATVMGVPVYQAEKTRDFATGKLSGFQMVDELPAEGKLLIVDDICDGGGTFLGLASATGLPSERLDLWVTHGIFSKGLGPLLDHFGVIHTTDSFFGSKPLYDYLTESHVRSGVRIKVHKIAPYFYGEIEL